MFDAFANLCCLQTVDIFNAGPKKTRHGNLFMIASSIKSNARSLQKYFQKQLLLGATISLEYSIDLQVLVCN